MYCLETSFLINFLRGDKGVRKKFNQLNGNILYTTSITAFELLKYSNDIENTKELLSRLNVLEFGMEEAEIAGELSRNMKKIGKIIESFDILIAAITIKNDLTLITSDKHFGKVIDLKVEIV